jgi:hypothetical protein
VKNMEVPKVNPKKIKLILNFIYMYKERAVAQLI